MHETGQTRRIIRFGAFELDLQARELRKQGLKLKLQRQPLQVLTILLERAGQAVSREELRKMLWSEDTFVDFDHGLNSAVNRIRRALGDSAGNPRFVETLPGHGYRFVAPVAGESPASFASRQPPSRRKLLVLPLQGTDCSDEDYLVDGLTEEVIAHLGTAHGETLGVIARNTALCYKNSPKSIKEIAEELDVDHVLTGKVSCAGNQLKITAEFIQAADQTYLWVKRYICDPAEIASLEREIAVQVASLLGATLPPAGRTTARRTEAAIRELYLRGRHYWNMRAEAHLRRALDFLHKAVANDPEYALAHASLADCYNLLAMRGYIAPLEAMPKSEAAASRALELDDQLAEAHAALGWVKWVFDWDGEGGEAELKQAIQLNPASSTVHHSYGSFLVGSGRFDEAIALIRAALEIDPLSLPTHGLLTWALVCARRYEEAIAQALKIAALDPSFAASEGSLAVAYALAGLHQQASATADAYGKASHREVLLLAALGFTYAAAGQRQKARDILSELTARAREGYVPATLVAPICAALGMNQEAFSWLEKAFEERCVWLPWANVDPRFDSLRQEARFRDLLTKLAPKAP